MLRLLFDLLESSNYLLYWFIQDCILSKKLGPEICLDKSLATRKNSNS